MDNDTSNNRYAIIVAGGSGSRFGSDTPKQFLPLEGKPVLMHTIEKFALVGAQVVVVLQPDNHDMWLQMCTESNFKVSHIIASGGRSRFESVKNGIAAIPHLKGDDLVAIHDGVRPLVTTSLIERCYATAHAAGSAIPVVNPSDTIRQVLDGGGSRQLVRAELRAVQTPQTFLGEWLMKAYDVEESPLFTDDASVVENSGHEVTLVEGDPANIKITHPIDLAIASLLMREGKNSPAT